MAAKKTKQSEEPKVEVVAKPWEEFLNPFDTGVSYRDFLRSLPKGKTATEHLKEKCTKEELEWLEIELKQYKSK